MIVIVNDNWVVQPILILIELVGDTWIEHVTSTV